MEYKYHAPIAGVATTLLAYVYNIHILTYIILLILSLYAARFPDYDRGGHHRHWFHHSCIPILWMIPLIMWFPEAALFTSSIPLAVGLHLLSDIHIRKEKRRGFYCIHKWKGDRMSGNNSTGYLIVNGIIATILALVPIIYI